VLGIIKRYAGGSVRFHRLLFCVKSLVWSKDNIAQYDVIVSSLAGIIFVRRPGIISLIGSVRVIWSGELP